MSAILATAYSPGVSIFLRLSGLPGFAVSAAYGVYYHGPWYLCGRALEDEKRC